MYHMDLITQDDFQNEILRKSKIFYERILFLNLSKVAMEAKFSKLKETLKPDKFTDEEFPIKSAENNPWLKDRFH